MRIVHYSVVNKITGKRIFVHCDSTKAQEYLNALPDKENHCITYKWLSI